LFGLENVIPNVIVTIDPKIRIAAMTTRHLLEIERAIDQRSVGFRESALIFLLLKDGNTQSRIALERVKNIEDFYLTGLTHFAKTCD
jgi:hypothetical protein